jgi:hypothetical protein
LSKNWVENSGLLYWASEVKNFLRTGDTRADSDWKFWNVPSVPQFLRRNKMKVSTKTRFSLSIVESLEFRDERKLRFEGKILTDILRLSGMEVEYLYIRTRKELTVALQQFYRSRNRYLHISCHGNVKEIALTLDAVPFEEFGEDLAPYMENRRLFFSACEVVNENLASAVMNQSGCQSIIGPRKDILFGDAALMWATFYHLMFRDPKTDVMKGGKIRWALRRVHHTFQKEFDYFTRAKGKKGYEKVDIQER